METNRHTIKAHRGETFTIDKVIQNKDGTPYIINNELQNPYLLITVSDNEHGDNRGFNRNYWLDLKNYPKFVLTQPLDSNEIAGWTGSNTFPTVQAISNTNLRTYLYNNMTTVDGQYSSNTGLSGLWTWNNTLSVSGLTSGTKYAFKFRSNGKEYTYLKLVVTTDSSDSGYKNLEFYYDTDLVMTARYASVVTHFTPTWVIDEFRDVYIDVVATSMTVTVNSETYQITPYFAVIHDTSTGEYIYWNKAWKNYECRFVKTFHSDDTKDWPAQRYFYSIQLVYGTKNREYLQNLADEYSFKYNVEIPARESFASQKYMSNIDIYEALIALGCKFPVAYDPDAPLYNPSSIPLLSKAELIIENYPEGGIY